MNARQPAAALAHYQGVLAESTQARIDAAQPQIADCRMPLIASGVSYGDYVLDFYGEDCGEDGYSVTAVALHGHKFDLSSLFTNSQMIDFNAACDRHNTPDYPDYVPYDTGDRLTISRDF